MPPTILIVGATGNTGRGVMATLPQLIKASSQLRHHRILALTRSKDSAAAKKIAQIPGVELAGQNWVEITADWLREREVVRIFIASHNEPKQFAEEGQFQNEALTAGVKYVVRISTTAANVQAGFRSYYARSHWALETMLEQPQYSAMHWTSLQPNVFTGMVVAPAAELIKKHRETGEQGTLEIVFDKDVGAAPIDPFEVGVVAAHLLAQDDTSKYNKKKLVLNGPEDISGSQIVELVEGYIGEKVKNPSFRDTSFIDRWADAQTAEAKSLIRSIKAAPTTAWSGEAQSFTTSKEVLEIAAPKNTTADALKALLTQ